MTDFMDTLATDAKATVVSGYYDQTTASKHTKSSLRDSILQNGKLPIIAEVKGASPSKGTIRHGFLPEKILRRNFAIVAGMIRDVAHSLIGGDLQLAKSVVARDDESNRLYFLLVR